MDTDSANTQPRVPASWPGGFGIYKYSRNAMRVNLVTWLFIGLLAAAVSIALQLVFRQFGSLASNLIAPFFSVATIMVYLANVKGQKVSFKETLSAALPFWLRALVLEILIVFVLLGSFLLLIVPFFIVLPRLMLAHYFLIDKNMEPVDAFKASWHATKGHSGKVWGIIGATVCMSLLIFTIIGIPLAIYLLIMYSCASALLYKFLTSQAAEAAPAPAAPTAPTPPPAVTS